ncbi:hypothetical protein [Victivallis lenta]|uniref:hypothetical protein n=1 Tax=Victivallis lenta TaxID=2606640 RepID=UPI002589D987|nr:hypothetical protein [uncultured Victivallis sp.]MBS5529639.1 hypothetical protein [bacterium]
MKQLHASIKDENSLSAPIIQIHFRGENYFLMPEGLADFTIRLYSDFKQRRPPFTQAMLNRLRREQLEITDETLTAVEHLLFGGKTTDDMPWNDMER